MRSRRLFAVLLLAAAAAALLWLRPWESGDPSPEPLAPGERTVPERARSAGRGVAPPSREGMGYREVQPGDTRAPSPPPDTITIPAVPTLSGRLRGRAVDMEGRAIEGASVLAFRPPTAGEMHPDRQPGDTGASTVFW